MSDEIKWHRLRFFVPGVDDYRPITFPPPGPYWCSGYRGDDDAAVIVAYMPAGRDVKEFWPEAEQINDMGEQSITFTDRFPKPDWWKSP